MLVSTRCNHMLQGCEQIDRRPRCRAAFFAAALPGERRSGQRRPPGDDGPALLRQSGTARGTASARRRHGNIHFLSNREISPWIDMHEVITVLIRSRGKVGAAEHRGIGDDAYALWSRGSHYAQADWAGETRHRARGKDLGLCCRQEVGRVDDRPQLVEAYIEVSAHDCQDQLTPLGAHEESFESALASNAKRFRQRLDGRRARCVDALTCARGARGKILARETAQRLACMSNHTQHSSARRFDLVRQELATPGRPRPLPPASA